MLKEVEDISWEVVDIFLTLKNQNILPDFVVRLASRDEDFSLALRGYNATDY